MTPIRGDAGVTLPRRGDVPITTATVVPLGCRGRISSRPRIRSALSAMIARPYRPSGLVSRHSLPIIGDFDLGEWRVDDAGHPEVLGAGVLAGVGDRLLRDPQQFGLDRRPAAGRSTRPATCAPAGRPTTPTVRAYSEIAAARPPCRSTSLRSSNRDSRSSVMTRVTSARSVRSSSAASVGVVGQHRERVVDAVADHDQFLRDAVVDLPGQPLALLVGGERPHLVEEQRGLQPERGRGGERGHPADRRRRVRAGARPLRRAAVRPCGRRSPAARRAR